MDRVSEEIEDGIGLDATEAIHVSAKSGLGTEDPLEAIVTRLPAPSGDREAPTRGLILTLV